MFRSLFSRSAFSQEKKPKKFRSFLEFLFPPLLVLLILLALFAHFKITPFGNNTLATMDGNIQYVDYFDYYKDVLDGENTVDYTFSKELGGNAFGVFSYYLASPINLLLKFFPEDKIELFFTVAVTIRLMLAALTFYIFLKGRIEKNPSKKQYLLFLIFSLFYALSSYSLQQSSNLMWLDGVWLLPLMMLGVSKIFEKKNPKLFIIASACALIFNWYSGFIALLFCVFFFFIELILRNLDQKTTFKKFIGFFWANGWRLLVSTIIAILISCVVLVPALKGLGEGSRGGGIDLEFLHTSLRGSVLSTFANYYPGTISNSGMMSLFIGALSILTFIAAFVSKEVKLNHKIAYFAIIVLTLLLFYFGPFYFVFSLLKDVGSYWCRFSFGCFMILLFLAAYILKTEKIKPSNFIVSGIVFFSTSLVFDHIDAPVKLRFYYSVFVILIAVILYFYATAKSTRFKTVTFILLLLASLDEITVNSYLVLKRFTGEDRFTAYATSQGEIIEKIKASDDSTYRVNNITTRCSFCLNDALSHSYYSIDGYTSSPDDEQIRLLDALGYKRWFYQSNITHDSILASDSLLGVKYFVNGDEISENSCALPLALSVAGTSAKEISDSEYLGNTFEFSNELFKKLSGLDKNLYEKVDFKREIRDSEAVYKLNYKDSDNTVLYGEIRSDKVYNATLIDGDTTIGYLKKVSPSVVKLNSNEITLKFDDEDSISSENITDEFFYYLDLSVLEEMTEKIKSENKVSDLALNNSSVSFTVDSTESQTVFTSIHYQNGWTITVNGEEVEPTLFKNSLITFDLRAGKNEVKFSYHLPGFKLGLMLFGVGIISAIVFVHISKSLRKDQF